MTQTIKDFINKFENHPILFIGTGISMRYLHNSYDWANLLKKVCIDLIGDEEHFINLKNKVHNPQNKEYDYAKLASLLESQIDDLLIQDNKNDLHRQINNVFYETMKKGIHTSRLKIYISKLLEFLDFKSEMNDEIKEFKKASKNVGSIITTNYDTFIEDIFDFKPLIGNDILLSNPYGSVYKIHGSVDKAEKIIITEADYKEFDRKYELIRAQLLSMFTHNPIIFLGYSISDDNIRKILETIFSYVDTETDLFEKIKDNFLLVEYDKGSKNNIVTDFDVSIDGISIRINKLRTDDYFGVYKEISNLSLPISAMDVRRVSSVVNEIYKGGKKEDSVKVRITEDPENLANSDMVLAIGSQQTISYVHKSTADIIGEYFEIVENRQYQVIDVIDDIFIQPEQFFPMYGFRQVNNDIEKATELIVQQNRKIATIKTTIEENADRYAVEYDSIKAVRENVESKTNIPYLIIWNVLENNIDIDEFEKFLKEYDDELSTEYRRYLCVYDFVRYKDD